MGSQHGPWTSLFQKGFPVKRTRVRGATSLNLSWSPFSPLPPEGAAWGESCPFSCYPSVAVVVILTAAATQCLSLPPDLCLNSPGTPIPLCSSSVPRLSGGPQRRCLWEGRWYLPTCLPKEPRLSRVPWSGPATVTASGGLVPRSAEPTPRPQAPNPALSVAKLNPVPTA